MPEATFWDGPVVGTAIRGVFALKHRAAKRLLGTTRDPAGSQERCLKELLEHNAETTYGKRYGFDSIESPREFQESVPLIDYEDIRGIVDTIADGSDPQALTKDPVIAFSTSSGTTNKPKLIPITKGAVKKETRVKDAYFAFLMQDYSDIVNGKWFYLFNRIDVGRTPTGLTFGSNAGYMFVTTPTIARRRFFPLPYEVCLIEDYESRYYTILRFLIAADLRLLICINPFSALLLPRLMDAWKDDLLDDLAKGRLKRDLELTDEQRTFFSDRLPAEPERARELRAAADRRGRLEPRDYWPNLRVTCSWKTGHSRFFAERVGEWFGDLPVREIGYGSSEFRTGLVIDKAASENIPVPDNYFYEFIPFDDPEPYRAGRKTLLLLHELEEGRKYYLVQSGIHGLYRYQVQDIVAINGRYNETPTFEFVQKAGSYTSLAGEDLFEFQFSDAMEGVGSVARELEPVFFVAYADAGDRRYRVAAEFTSHPNEEARQRFCALLDERLRAESQGYDRARVERQLESPELHVLGRGQGDEYVQWVSMRALYDMQAKIHRLKPDLQDDFDHLGISLQPV